MDIIKNPERSEWSHWLKRPSGKSLSVERKVKKILREVRKNGDKAVRAYTKVFDGAKLKSFRVEESEMQDAALLLSDELKAAIAVAKSNIEKFHSVQQHRSQMVETMPGVRCWTKNVAIERVGLYVPGGTAPLLSTVLMLGIPANIAGCREIILCSPPGKKGSIDPAILYCAQLSGITRIFKVGGAQAIAAMAFGTKTIPRVYKIFGPGNQYVTAAKQLAQQYGVAIDMPAGPTELAMYADDSADAAFIAADLLSQAEHGAGSQVLLVLNDYGMVNQIKQELESQLETLPRKELSWKALKNSRIIILKSPDDAMELLNEYAPEHLILNCRDAEALAEKVINAGSVFVGPYTPESAGDYASGTNHTLPTNGYAKAFSGVSVDSFLKKISFQQINETGLRNIGHTVKLLAEAEGLQAHSNSISARFKTLDHGGVKKRDQEEVK